MTDYLIGADQKILDRSVKMTFVGVVESTIRLGIKPEFGGWPDLSDSLLGCDFLSNILKHPAFLKTKFMLI